MVPSIPVSANKIQHMIERADLVNTVYIVPKWTSDLIQKEFEAIAFQLCFTHSECDMFTKMPIALKQAYMAIKTLLLTSLTIDDCPVKLYISSYMVKTKTFECFADTPEFADVKHNLHHASENEDDVDDVDVDDEEADVPLDQPTPELQYIKDIQKEADKILSKLQTSFEKKKQQSFFLRGCNLIAHPIYKEDYKPLVYLR